MATNDDISCFECGSDEPSWCGSLESLGSDYDALKELAKKGILRVKRVGNRLHVTGARKVGLLLLPSGRRVVIRSKVPNIVILEWLAFLEKIPDLEVWRSDPAVTWGGSFHDCIGRLFIRELDELTRRFLRKDYVPLRCSSSTLRGKVLTNRLCGAMQCLPNVPQLTRTRTLHTQYNAVLALALDKVPILMSDEAAVYRRDLARLRDEWAHISRETADVVSAVTHAQWACPAGYRSALQLARLILLGAVVDSRGGTGGQVFTVSLAEVWEKGLRRIFRELQATTGWKLRRRKRRWADATEEIDKNRWMCADIRAERHGVHWVLDTKYKRDFGYERRADRFQACAYALGFAAQRATIVYPTGSGASVDLRLLLDAKIGNRTVRIDSIELPMAEGPEACKEAVKSLCGLPDLRAVGQQNGR